MAGGARSGLGAPIVESKVKGKAGEPGVKGRELDEESRVDQVSQKWMGIQKRLACIWNPA